MKLLAAVGALEYLPNLGFSGAARINMEGRTSTVADVYAAAIAESSNEAYDQLVRIAGVDWLNAEFLAGANGFPATVIQHRRRRRRVAGDDNRRRQSPGHGPRPQGRRHVRLS